MVYNYSLLLLKVKFELCILILNTASTYFIRKKWNICTSIV